ncbi:MAG: hypothetical protein RL318_113 [Fibrobacterota bacterium]
MAYRWQKTDNSQLIEVIRLNTVTFDTWILFTEDPALASDGTSPVSALWFSSLEEVSLFMEERFLSLWLPKGETIEEVVTAARKLGSTRRIQKRTLAQFMDLVNEKMEGKVSIAWLGTFNDLLGNQDPAIIQISQDLEFWFVDRGIESADIDLDNTKQQKAAVEFFLQLGT